MASIILVEDVESIRNRKVRMLKSAEHSVLAPEFSTRAEFLDAFNRLFLEFNDKRIDFLILDMQLSNNLLGGLELYNRLVQGGHRPRWLHTLIYTRHTPKDIASAKYDINNKINTPEVCYRIFVDTAQIPPENVIQANMNPNDGLLGRIQELYSLPEDSSCVFCGSPPNPDSGGSSPVKI